MIAYSLRFLWVSSRGYRLRPWRSPLLRWRIETYTGIPAESITFAIFFREMWNARRELWQFLRWGAAMRRLERQTQSRA
ncbi:MAG: hypothetical protein EXQ56_13965 [Acidobacteria bacterium]|nr:hypothetical protein [Acidobacteriota bacterium]